MREIVFHVLREQHGQLEASALGGTLTITAATLEELHHEARDALIALHGAAHATYRARIRRAKPASGIRPLVLTALPA
ncbi:MAG: hypothetical protein ACKO5F_10030 [Synechococcus sp.]